MQGTGGIFVLVVMEVRKRGLQGTSQRLLRTSPFLEISGCVLPLDVHQFKGSMIRKLASFVILVVREVVLLTIVFLPQLASWTSCEQRKLLLTSPPVRQST